MEKNLKNIKKQMSQMGVFYTPKEDAEKLKALIDVQYNNVYDPTCGQGNLLSVFDDEIQKYGQEIDYEELKKAESTLKNFIGYCGDTLSDDGFKGMEFELIMANPPFSLKWEQNPKDERFSVCKLAPKSKADWAFNLHIIHHLKHDGQAIVLNFPGTAYRSGAEKEIREYFIENNLIEKVISYPPNTFVDTNIATIIYVFKKNKKTTDVVFVDDDGIEKVVSQDEIKQNDYNLSVSMYIEKEVEKENIDIEALNDSVWNNSRKNIIKELEWDKNICEMNDEPEKHMKHIHSLIEDMKRYERNIIEKNKKSDYQLPGQMSIEDII